MMIAQQQCSNHYLVVKNYKRIFAATGLLEWRESLIAARLARK